MNRKIKNLPFISLPQFFNISSGLTVAKNGETKLARKWRDIVEILSIVMIFFEFFLIDYDREKKFKIIGIDKIS